MSHDLLIENLTSIWWIFLSAVLAPICALLCKKYIPDVIWLLIFGILIGPNMFKISDMTESVEFLRELGMGFLFLLAGFEVNTFDLKKKQGKHAFITWIISFILALCLAFIFTKGELNITIVLAIAATSTALGTLLPILKDSNLLNSPLGKSTIIHGAYGELLPIIAMSLLLSSVSTWKSSIILILFSIISVIVVMVPIKFFRKIPLLGKAFVSSSNTTMQTTLRITVFLLVTLMLLTVIFNLDIALGAFLAGILISRVLTTFSPDQEHEIAQKVEVVGFSFLIPIFFITSGMKINPFEVIEKWPLLLGFFIFIVITRGLFVFLREQYTKTFSGLESFEEKISLGLFSATSLPIIVAVSGIAESTNIIDQVTASTLITSGALTILIFPLIANILLKK